MRSLLTVLFLTGYLASAKGQVKSQNTAIISIDHIPIVVKDLDKVKNVLSESLRFKIKEGKEHEGIKNCFIKFRDGTYLEFTTPVDSAQPIGKYYTDFLKNRQGGTAIAISVNSSEPIITTLTKNAIPFKINRSRGWNTITPQGMDLFFINYSGGAWKDSKANTTHRNHAFSLKSVFILSANMELDIKKYRSVGINEITGNNYLGIPCKIVTIGQSNLYLLDETKSGKIKQALHSINLNGLCGFEIKTASLSELNKQLEQNENIIIEKKQTIIYLQELNFFLVFTE